MTRETYRKYGRSVRLERVRNDRALIRVAESGEAETRAGLFSCRSLPADLLPAAIDEAQVIATEEAIAGSVPRSLFLERLIVTSGVANHELESASDHRVWSETSFRIHASIINRDSELRMLWDDASPDAATPPDSAADLKRAIAALHSVRRESTPALLRIELTGRVAASLWPALVMALASAPSDERTAARFGMTIHQWPDVGYRLDGNGEPIAGTTLFDGHRVVDPWPNVFRPTYRRRPVAMPMNARVVLERNDDVEPEAVAAGLLAPPRMAVGDVILDVLAAFDGAAAPMRITMSPPQWCDAVVSLRGPERWYPYGAGSFGRSTVIDLERVGRRAQLL